MKYRTAVDVLEFVLRTPGVTARQVAQRVFGEAEPGSTGRTRAHVDLRALTDLGLLEMYKNATPAWRYREGWRYLAARRADG